MYLKGGWGERDKGVGDKRTKMGGKRRKGRQTEREIEREALRKTEGRRRKRRGEPKLEEIAFFLFNSSCLGFTSESSCLQWDEKWSFILRGRSTWGKWQHPAKPHKMEDFQPNLWTSSVKCEVCFERKIKMKYVCFLLLTHVCINSVQCFKLLTF